MSYTDKELQKAKDVLEACNFVSPSTKGCYSSRIALWIHFCNQCCRGDDIVTEEKLADYVEWLVSSGSAERIRQGNTHVQQVLRNQLQGVLCYWRIQTGNRDDLSDPRLSPVFMAKWQQIAMRYPRPRQSRRSEPIYGAPSHSGDTETVTPGQTGTNTPILPGMGAASNQIKRIPDRQSASQRQFHYAQHQALRPPADMIVHDTKPSFLQLPPPPSHYHPYSGALPHSSSMRHYGGRDGPVHVVPLPPVGHQAYRNETVVDNDDDRAPGAAATVPNQSDECRAYSRSGATTMSDSPQQQQQPLSDEKLLLLSRSSLPGSIPGSVPEWEENVNTVPEGHLLTNMEAMAVNLRQLEMDNNLQYQIRAICNLGLASWLPIDNRLSLTLTDIGVEDVVHPITLKQQSTATQVTKKNKSPAAVSNTSNSAPISPTNHTEEEVTSGDGQDSKTTGAAQSMPPLSAGTTTASSSANSSPKISDKTDISSTTSAVTVAKALSVAIHNGEHNDGNSAASAAKQNKALILRHKNPLLCAWSSLAIWFFWKWHIAKEPAPDFATLNWQLQHLFVNMDGVSGPTSKFESLFHDAFSTVSTNRLDGAKVMPNKGYFYAEAFGLVHPTANGIKGLDCVDSIDSQTLDTQVWTELTKINAGYDSEIYCSDGDRKEEVIDVPGRFNVMPSQALQKEIFPWIMPLLQKAYEQSNNDQVRHATRFLRMLKDLRIVLLQDVAYLMEVPLLKEMTKTNKMFSSAVFASPEFEAYRSEMQAALGETELKETHELCLATLKWVEEHKSSSSASEDGHSRLQPTAPRLSPSEIEAAREKAMARQRKNEEAAATAAAKALLGSSNSRKRQLGDNSSDLPNSNGGGGGILNNTVEGQTKRSRRVYNSIANAASSPYRGHSASSTSVTMSVAAAAAATAISPSGSSQHLQMQSSAELVMAIEDLRMENEDLRAQMQRIELGLNQQRSEVRSWMNRIEKSMQQANSSRGTPPALPPNPSRYSASPGNPNKGGGPTYHHESSYPQQPQQPQPPMLPPHSSPYYGRQQAPQPLPVSASSHPHNGYRGYEDRYYQGPPPPSIPQIPTQAAPTRSNGRKSPSSQSNYSLNSKLPSGGASSYNYNSRPHQQGQIPRVSSVSSLVHQHPPPSSVTENGSGMSYSQRLPSPRASHHQPPLAQPSGYGNPPITPSGQSRGNGYASHPGAVTSWYPPPNSPLPSVYSGQHGGGSPPAAGPRV